MKNLLFICLTFVWPIYLLGQGQVQFANYIPGSLITHIYAPLPGDPGFHQTGNGTDDLPGGSQVWSAFTLIGANGTNGLYGAENTMAQLLGAVGFNQPASSLEPGTPVTTFRTGTRAGNIVSTTATFGNIPYGADATIEFVAWDNASGLYPTWREAFPAWSAGLIAAGTSGPMDIQLGSATQVPAELIGLQSFNISFIPEPSPTALLSIAAAFSLGRIRRAAKW
jgi:hypothetical protein